MLHQFPAFRHVPRGSSRGTDKSSRARPHTSPHAGRKPRRQPPTTLVHVPLDFLRVTSFPQSSWARHKGSGSVPWRPIITMTTHGVTSRVSRANRTHPTTSLPAMDTTSSPLRIRIMILLLLGARNQAIHNPRPLVSSSSSSSNNNNIPPTRHLQRLQKLPRAFHPDGLQPRWRSLRARTGRIRSRLCRAMKRLVGRTRMMPMLRFSSASFRTLTGV